MLTAAITMPSKKSKDIIALLRCNPYTSFRVPNRRVGTTSFGARESLGILWRVELVCLDELQLEARDLARTVSDAHHRLELSFGGTDPLRATPRAKRCSCMFVGSEPDNLIIECHFCDDHVP
jgi:hypothetical protein